jgi:aminopeptidase C
MLVVGWEFYRGEPVFTIQNSWGTRWGRGGLFRIDARLFQEWNHVFDLWTAGDEYY